MLVTAIALSVAINIILMAFAYIRLSKEIGRRRKSDSLLREIREEAEEIVREINQVTDRNVGLIEDSIRRLTEKLSDADKRITLLGKAAENKEKERITYSHLRRPLTEMQNPLPDFDQMRGDEKESSAKQKQETQPPLRERVLEMSRNGFSSQVIAQKTGATVGEVELMINLSSGREEVEHGNRY
ncbi:DUF6115 domain-containing protein [Sediminispirochaeta bajacaliforniensis]|uniref:DUF6115 domain-containing protein n=1 Tax=Sediminispirochaeta bajacaliforniensis TaxID=148 RepID=UPI00036FE246|nr:hypothetical protein [Sediminispirochaeta bajacaliforniensis]